MKTAVASKQRKRAAMVLGWLWGCKQTQARLLVPLLLGPPLLLHPHPHGEIEAPRGVGDLGMGGQDHLGHPSGPMESQGPFKVEKPGGRRSQSPES